MKLALSILLSVTFLALADEPAANSEAKQITAMTTKISQQIKTRENIFENLRPQRPDLRSAENDEIRKQMMQKYSDQYSQYRTKIWQSNIDILNSSAEFYSKFPNEDKAKETLPEAVNILALVGGDDELSGNFESFYTKLINDKTINKDIIETTMKFRHNQLRALIGQEIAAEEKEAKIKALLEKYSSEIDIVAPLFTAKDPFPSTALSSVNELVNYNPQLAQQLIVKCEKYGGDAIKKNIDQIKKKIGLMGKEVKIAITTLDNKKISLEDYKGKVVLIDFWATWCGPCVSEMPRIVDLYSKYHDKGFETIGISLDNEIESLKNFVKEKGIAWPQSFDGKGWQNKYVKEFDVKGIPTMLLIDKDGKLSDLNGRQDTEAKIIELLK